MKVVLDTNVLVAAFAARGLCEAVFVVCLERHDLLISEHILKELRRHLTGTLKIPTKQGRQIVSFLRQYATLVNPAKLPKSVCRDPDDVPVLGTAVAGDADSLVTGDGDLLAIKHFRKIPILAPRAFYDLLR